MPGPFSQHFIFFVTFKRAHELELERPAKGQTL